MKKAIFVLLVIVLISGCHPKQSFSKDVDYFSQNKSDYIKYKNLNLSYEWDFNESLKSGGLAYRRNYFEVKNFSIINTSTIPYLAHFKHEEGHILQLNLLNTDSLDEFYDKNKRCNKIDPLKSYYFVSVDEGGADYYAIKYFNDINNSLGTEYSEYTKIRINKDYGYKQYYRGFLFANYTISHKIYSGFEEFVLNWCTEKQFEMYDNFVKKLNLN